MYRTLLLDAALAIVSCYRECGSHYYQVKYYYWNFIKSTAHRGVTAREFPSVTDQLKFEASIKEQLLKFKEKDDRDEDVNDEKREQLQTVAKMMTAA